MVIWEKRIHMIENSKCKGPEAGSSLEDIGSMQKGSIAGSQQGS